MIRFYGFSYREVMELPIRVFWGLNSQIPRLRCDEALALMPATTAAGMGADVEKVVRQLRAEIGEPVRTVIRRAAKSEIAKLRAAFGRGT